MECMEQATGLERISECVVTMGSSVLEQMFYTAKQHFVVHKSLLNIPAKGLKLQVLDFWWAVHRFGIVVSLCKCQATICRHVIYLFWVPCFWMIQIIFRWALRAIVQKDFLHQTRHGNVINVRKLKQHISTTFPDLKYGNILMNSHQDLPMTHEIKKAYFMERPKQTMGQFWTSQKLDIFSFRSIDQKV